MNLQELSMEELQVVRDGLLEAEKATAEALRLVIDEILQRQRGELNDGYWTGYGYVKN